MSAPVSFSSSWCLISSWITARFICSFTAGLLSKPCRTASWASSSLRTRFSRNSFFRSTVLFRARRKGLVSFRRCLISSAVIDSLPTVATTGPDFEEDLLQAASAAAARRKLARRVFIRQVLRVRAERRYQTQQTTQSFTSVQGFVLKRFQVAHLRRSWRSERALSSTAALSSTTAPSSIPGVSRYFPLPLATNCASL